MIIVAVFLSKTSVQLYIYESSVRPITRRIIKSFCVFWLISVCLAWWIVQSAWKEIYIYNKYRLRWSHFFCFYYLLNNWSRNTNLTMVSSTGSRYLNVWVIVYIMLFFLYSKLKHTKAKWMTTIHNPIQTQQPDKRAHKTIWLNYMYTL